MDPLQTRLRDLGFRARGTARASRVVERRGRRYAIIERRLGTVRASDAIGALADAAVRARVDLPEHAALIVLRAPAWTAPMSARLLDYQRRYLAGTALGLLDDRGRLHLAADGVETAGPPRPRRRREARRPPAATLFTDLHQWLLKLLVKRAWELGDDAVAGRLPDPLATHAEVAAAAGVSVNRAWTMVRLLEVEGFWSEGGLIRIDEILERWRAVPQRRSAIPVRWRVGTDAPVQRLIERLQGRAAWRGGTIDWIPGRPRACLAGVAAAYGLGYGFVAGALPEVYVDRPDEATLRSLGVSVADSSQDPDLVLLVPRYPEAVFRACPPGLHGAPTADAIQSWIDVSHRPDRGAEQADVLRERVLHGP